MMRARFLPLFLAALLSAGPLVAEQAEFPVQTEALVAATDAYFTRIEDETAEKRAPTLTISRPTLAQRTSVSADVSDTLTQNGPVRHLTGYRINWYPVDRFLGSVDFMGTWDGNRNLVCGYLVWDVTDPNAPVLNSVSANFVDLEALRGKTQGEVHRRLLEANCAHGALDDNYAFFDVTAQ